MNAMADQETSPEPEVHYTETGNKIIVYPGAIYIAGNNNNVIANSHDISINIRKQTEEKVGQKSNPTNTVQKKDVKKKLLQLFQDFDEREDLSEEHNAEIMMKVSEILDMLRKCSGCNLRMISSGSLDITVSVHESYALKNLMESHMSGRLIRELAKIFVSESKVDEFCRTWSSHIDEQTYETIMCKLKIVEEKNSTSPIIEWNRSQVREWLSSELHMKQDIVNKIYEQEIIGKNLVLYENDDIQNDFSIKKPEFRMIQYSLEEKKGKEIKTQMGVEPVTDACNAARLSEILLKAGLAPIHVEKFINMEMTGFQFIRYREAHFNEDFNLPIGPLRLVLYLQKISRNIPPGSMTTEHPAGPRMATAALPTRLGKTTLEKLNGSSGTDSMSAEINRDIEADDVEKKISESINIHFTKSTTTGPMSVLSSQSTSFEGRKTEDNNSTQVTQIKDIVKDNNTLEREDIQSEFKDDNTGKSSRPYLAACKEKKTEKSEIASDELETMVHKVDVKTKPSKSKKKKKHGYQKEGSHVLTFAESEGKLRELLLGGCELTKTFDVVYDVILVVNDPDKEMHDNLEESFDFLSKVKWKAVFDFDAQSNNDGICKVMRTKQEVNLYDIKDLSNVSTPSEIKYADVTAWIFSNGRSDIDTNVMDRMTWIEDRSHDMDKAVEFFSNVSVIRRDRGLVIFMLLSDNIEVMSEAFRKFYTDFGIDRIVVISEKVDVFEEWCKLVSKYCKPEKLYDRAIVGVLLNDLNNIMLRMQGVNVKADYVLPTSDGKCYLFEKDKSKWVDLSVVTYNECENTDMDEGHPDFRRFCKERELEFYKGEKLSFWNFKLNEMKYNHVCERDVMHEIVEAVNSEIQQPTQQAKHHNQAVFHWFDLYHQPGAGGSTVVKHVLWKFRKKYRCVVLKKITDQTESQILEMWSYGERSGNVDKRCLPLLIVSDNLCYEDLTDMVISLEYKTKHVPDRICIILNCVRALSLKDIEKEKPITYHRRFSLGQSLSDKERTWFHSKHVQLEKKMEKDNDFKPDRLLAFMVMKEEFRPEYVKKTVGRILADLKEHHEREFELVKFCSLFSKFERDSAIPIPCCDEFMGFAFSAKSRQKRPWEYDRSESSSVLMITVDIHDVGSVQGFKIVHPTVADFILKDTTLEPLNRIVINYLNAKLLASKSHSAEYLAARTHDLLIKRNQIGFIDSTKQKFSDLILSIKEINKEDACEVLIQGFNILKDPMIAQQVARFYNIVMEDHEKALEYIEKAINMKRGNPFLWDTKGQIYRKELSRSFYQKYVVYHELISIDESINMLKLGFSGIDSFHQSQNFNRKDNTSSFSSEVDITFKMLDVLICLDVLKRSSEGRNILQRYLVDRNYKPIELSKLAEYHTAMKGLMKNVQVAIDTLTNYFTFQKEWSNFTKIGKSEFEDLKLRVSTFLRQWDTHFGSIHIEETIRLAPETLDELRRLKARKLGGHSIRTIFGLATDDNVERLLEIKILLLKNDPYSAFDLKTVILTNLALSTALNRKKRAYNLPCMKEMIDLAKEYDQRDQKERNFSLYAPMFLLMLLWPRNQPADEYDNKLMKKSLAEIRKRWSASQRPVKEDDGHQTLHPVYGRHLKIQRSRKKPLVHFFLGSGKGLKALVHQTRISSNYGRLDREQVWQSPFVKENLLKVDGILSENNNIIFKHEYTDQSIQIPLASVSDTTVTSREEVSFYIGFSWGGPVAYYVKPKSSLQVAVEVFAMEPETWRSAPTVRSSKKDDSLHMSVPEYQKKYNVLTRKLSEIEDLERKARQGKKLEKNQEDKIAKKGELAHHLKDLEDEFKKQIEMMDSSLGE